MPTPEPSPTPGPAQRILSALGGPGQARSVAELSSALGVHPNTVRAALAELRTAGLVQRDRARGGGRGRPSYDYSLTPAGRSAQPSGRAFREYRSLTEAFASHVADRSEDPGADARAIGRTWGAALAGDNAAAADGSEARTEAGGTRGRAEADAAMVDLLAELGFGPDPDADGIALRTCPLLDLAREMPEVICQVHRGLVEGALDHYGAPSSGVELTPFAEVGACRLHLHGPPGQARQQVGAPAASPAPTQNSSRAGRTVPEQ